MVDLYSPNVPAYQPNVGSYGFGVQPHVPMSSYGSQPVYAPSPYASSPLHYAPLNYAPSAYGPAASLHLLPPPVHNPYPSAQHEVLFDEQDDAEKPVNTRRMNSNVQSGIQQIGQGNMNLQGNIQQVGRRSSLQFQNSAPLTANEKRFQFMALNKIDDFPNDKHQIVRRSAQLSGISDPYKFTFHPLVTTEAAEASETVAPSEDKSPVNPDDKPKTVRRRSAQQSGSNNPYIFTFSPLATTTASK